MIELLPWIFILLRHKETNKPYHSFNAILMVRQSGQKITLVWESGGKTLFPKLHFTQFVNQDVKIIEKKIVFAKFGGCSLERRRSVNFSNCPYICL